ncbi:MAG: hypothetical protein VKL39_21805, partial [Leptolyngbyaceae bacterium]|nr:hypothetical protein [Leptolyngbyaceae bacterium]
DPVTLTGEFRALFEKNFQITKELSALSRYLGYENLSPDLSVHCRTGAWVIDGAGTACVTTAETIAKFAYFYINQSGLENVFVCSSNPGDALKIAKDIDRLVKTCTLHMSRAFDFQPSFLNSGIAILDFLTIKKSRMVLNSGISTFSAFAALLGQAELVTFLDSETVVSRAPVFGSGLGI